MKSGIRQFYVSWETSFTYGKYAIIHAYDQKQLRKIFKKEVRGKPMLGHDGKGRKHFRLAKIISIKRVFYRDIDSIFMEAVELRKMDIYNLNEKIKTESHHD